VHALIAACRRARVCRQLAACRVGICCKQLSRLPPLLQLQQQPYPAGALLGLLFAASAAPTTATAALPCRCSFQIALSGCCRSYNCNSSPTLPVLFSDCSSRLPPLPQLQQQPCPAGALFRLLSAASAAPTTATAALPCRCSFGIALRGFRRSHNCNSSPALPVLFSDCSQRLPPLPQLQQQPCPAGALFRLLSAASAAPTTATAALPCRYSFQIVLRGFRRSHRFGCT